MLKTGRVVGGVGGEKGGGRGGGGGGGARRGGRPPLSPGGLRRRGGARLGAVPAALSGRAYGEGGPLVFEVRDAVCEWNDGRWKLEDGVCERTDAEPDVALDVFLQRAELRFVRALQGKVDEDRRRRVRRNGRSFLRCRFRARPVRPCGAPVGFLFPD